LNSPNPALVTQRAAQRLPRVALLLLCAAYVLPGLFGRDPWRHADVTAFGFMASISEGRSPWLNPSVAGLSADPALLPYWLGASFIRWFGPWLGEPLAARIPFALLLVLVLVFTWYSTYHLARTEGARPLPFAFGGEADPVDYARAIADGALLAAIATLGLLLLGHETTPELAQLAGVSLFLYAMAASHHRRWRARVALLVSLPALAASGAPGVAVALGTAGVLAALWSRPAGAGRLWLWIAASAAVAAALATALGAWAWHVRLPSRADQWLSIGKQVVWFTWPAWPLACWTLWRWRRHLHRAHIALPLGCVLVALATWLLMGGRDRALMLALPPLAVLAAFALPTLQRSTAAAIDWFSVFFFSICALAIWVIYIAMHTGVPAKPAANVARLVPGFEPLFQPIELAFAVLATLAWLGLVQWRTGRNRHPLWKSLVLPASGVALSWLLLMSLWLPLFDYARSYGPLLARLSAHLPMNECVAAVDVPPSQLAAMGFVASYDVDAATPLAATPCHWLVRVEPPRSERPAPAGWREVAREPRLTTRDEVTVVFRRTGNGAAPAGS